MSSLLIRDATVVTAPRGAEILRGKDLAALDVTHNQDILIREGIIESVGPNLEKTIDSELPSAEVDANGRIVMPSFVDCHTHACWAGNRFHEWTRKLAGATYQELLAEGGGIMSTVRSVRSATQQELVDQLLRRLELVLQHGTTAIEVKSGYGLSTPDELKMLRAIRTVDSLWPGRVRPTACIGHAIDADHKDPETFVTETIQQTLPAITAEFPGIPIDAYCEQDAWSLNDCRRLFDAAQEAGHPVRVHADQFNSLGMVELAIERGYRSVDHLEATDDDKLTALAKSQTIGVLLPCSGFHLDQRYGNGRRLVDAGGALAIATNYNPGSAPCYSIPMAIALAVRHLGLTPNEAINAATVNAAGVLGLTESGRIANGYRGDLIVLKCDEPAELAFEFGGNPVQAVICDGVVI